MKSKFTLSIFFLSLLINKAHAQCLVQIANFDQNPCANSTIELLAYPDDYSQVYTYTWTGPNGFSFTGPYIFIPNAQPENAGTYSVTMTSANGCSSQTEVVVIKNPVPVVYTGGEQGGCYGTMSEIYAVDISGEYGPYTYLWDGGQTSQVIQVSHYSNYPAPGCQVTNAYGCSAMNQTTFMIVTYPAPANPIIASSDPLVFCQGGNAVLNVQNPDSFQQYHWKRYANYIQGASSTSYLASKNGKYSVVTTNLYGCTAGSNKIQVVVHPKPMAEISVSGNTILCTGDSVLLSANNGNNLTYQWTRYNTPMVGKTSPTLAVNKQGNYRVIVSNEYGCSKTSAMISVTTGNCRLEQSLSETEEVTVFPNPSLSYFQLQFTSDEQEQIYIKVMDLSGRTIEEGMAGSGFQFGNQYPAGAYLLLCEINGTVIQRKLIKSE
jgi:hypothetical protein